MICAAKYMRYQESKSIEMGGCQGLRRRELGSGELAANIMVCV